MTETVLLTGLEARLARDFDIFVCVASFEERSATIARVLAQRIKKALVLRNRESERSSASQCEALKVLLQDRIEFVSLSLEFPTHTADALVKQAIVPIQGAGAANVFIDITTFTHEQLLIMIGLLRANPTKARVVFGYVGAEQYSINTDENSVWLTRGVKQIRSILGYPGLLFPSKQLHLMLLLGFESDRAKTIIEIMEPSRLSLGMGDVNQSVAPQHYARNKRFVEQVKYFVEQQKRTGLKVDEFLFSCIDPFKARDAVVAHAQRILGYNTVICPMNTKISTVGVGLAAAAVPRLQLVYALADEYNEAGYSKPSAVATIFEVPS